MEVTLLVEATENAFRILGDARKHAGWNGGTRGARASALKTIVFSGLRISQHDGGRCQKLSRMPVRSAVSSPSISSGGRLSHRTRNDTVSAAHT